MNIKLCFQCYFREETLYKNYTQQKFKVTYPGDTHICEQCKNQLIPYQVLYTLTEIPITKRSLRRTIIKSGK